MTRRTEWSDRPLWIIGGGPSLKGWDLSGLRSSGRVLGVNRAADFWPVDAVFTRDREFCRQRHADLARWASDGVEVHVGHDPSWGLPEMPSVMLHRTSTAPGFSEEYGTIHGLHSGFGAVNLAVLMGAREICLLGFDLHAVAREEPMHWHQGYAWGNRRSLIYYDSWARAFDLVKLPEDVTILNGNRESAVTAFPRVGYSALGL